VKWKGQISKEGKNNSLHSALLRVLHLVDGHFLERQGDNGSSEQKGPVETTPNRAGASGADVFSAAPD
jgi:hypothetical protein